MRILIITGIPEAAIETARTVLESFVTQSPESVERALPQIAKA